MTSALLFIALCFAAWRTWRLIGRDDITGFIRAKLPDFVLVGVQCPFCLGTWIAVASTYLVHRYVQVLEPHWLLWAVAVAGGVGLLGLVDEKLSG